MNADLFAAFEKIRDDFESLAPDEREFVVAAARKGATDLIDTARALEKAIGANDEAGIVCALTIARGVLMNWQE